MMSLLWTVLGIVAVAAALYFVATVIFGPGEPPQPAGEELASPLPTERDLTAEDLRAAVLPVSVRGYRMSDVDALIERMAQQLAHHERPDAAGALATDYSESSADQPYAVPEPAHELSADARQIPETGPTGDRRAIEDPAFSNRPGDGEA